MRFYKVTIQTTGDGGPREVVVPSKTDVQALDAAAALMKPGEAILSAEETDEPQARDLHQADGPPPGTQTHPDRPV